MNEDEIRALIAEYGARVFGVIQRQVPQRGNTPINPYATGALKNSLRWSLNKDNTISIRFFRYGIYTDKGTGQWAVPRQTNPFTERFVGYQRGKMGIKPQFWTALGGPEAVNALNEFTQELARELEAKIATTTTRNLANL
jgi:hypothetical protein